MITDDTSLAEVRAFLRKNWHEGVMCPACTRRVHLAENRPNRTDVRLLALLWDRYSDGEPFHLHAALHEICRDDERPPRSGDVAKWRYVGLLERVKDVAGEDGPHAQNAAKSEYTVTPLLGEWLRGEVTIPGPIYTYDRKFQGIGNEHLSVFDAMGCEFSLDTLVKSLRSDTEGSDL